MVKLITSNDLRPRQTEVAHAVMDGARWLVTTHGRPTFAVVSVTDLKRLEEIDGRELDLRRQATRELQSSGSTDRLPA